MTTSLGRTRVEPHVDPAVSLLLDRAAIRDVILRYSHCVDHRKFVDLAECFTPNVSGDFGGKWRNDRAELIEFISGVSHFDTTLHMMGNGFVEVSGDHASLESYAMVMHYVANADGTEWRFNLSDSMYVEKLVRGSQGWAIEQRAAEPEWAPRGVRGVDSADPAVRWLLDRAALHDQTMQLALGVDRREHDRIRACAAKEFRAVDRGREFTDIEAWLESLRELETYASTTHFLGTPLIELDGDGARVHTLAFVTRRQPGEERDKAPESATSEARCEDLWLRQGEGWRLTQRSIDDVPANLPIALSRAPETDEPQVQSLLDRAQISDLVSHTAHALDRGDFAAVAACFTPDGASFAEQERTELETWSQTNHLIGNHLVSIEGDTARSETYLYQTRRARPGEAASHWSRGARRWDDRFVRGADGWRIAGREVRICPIE